MLVGGGGIFLIGATMLFLSAADAAANLITFQPQEPKNILFSEILVFTGVAGMAGSIPLFISSRTNKRKAMNVSFTQQPVSTLVKNLTGNGYVPSVTIQLKL